MTHEVLHIGLYVIFGIIFLPVYMMILGWFLGKPRDFRSVAMTFGYMFVFIVGLIVGIGILGAVISIIMPF